MQQTTLLRPNQIAEYETTEESLEQKLTGPHSKYIQDKGAVRGQLKRLRHALETQRPQSPVGEEKDAMVKENKALLDEILVGMPSQEEMRKCPPGAIDKHRVWEKRNKQKILRWKNNQLRLNAGTDQIDIANLELHRPKKSSLNMDNAVISGDDYFLPEKVGYSVPFSDEDIRLLRERAPVDVWTKLPTLTAEQRTLLRQVYLDTWEDPVAQTPQATVDEATVDVTKVPDDVDAILDELEEDEEEAPPLAAETPVDAEPSMSATESLADASGLWPDDEPPKPSNATRNKRRTRR